MHIRKRTFMAIAAGLVAATALSPAFAQDKELPFVTIAEPSHNLGYLPLYVAQRKGFFEKEGIQVSTLMITGGSTAANAALTGQTFGFVGSADHAALAKARGKDLVAVVGMVARGNIYLTARAGVDTTGDPGGANMDQYLEVANYGAWLWVNAMDRGVPVRKVKQKYLTVRSGRGRSWWAVDTALRIITSRRFPLEKMCTHTFGLDDVDLAIKATAGREVEGAIHCIVDPWK